MADTTLIRVVQGANVWRLLRTDRDGASAGEIPRMAAPAVRWFLLRGTADMAAKHEIIPTGHNEWRIGPIRPLKVLSVTRDEPNVPVGETLADRQTSLPRTIPAVSAQRPWWVMVQFWWREPAKMIPFPGLREGFLGKSYQLAGADWLLDRAIAPAASIDPGGQTWGEAMGENVEDAAGRVTNDLFHSLEALGGGLVVALLLMLLGSRKD